MYRPRFTVAAVMAIVLVAAIVFAALHNPTRLWASVFFSLVLSVLSTAAVLGLADRGHARTAWLGMAVWGFTYVHFAFDGEPGYPPLITRPLLDWLADMTPGSTNRVLYLHNASGRSARAVVEKVEWAAHLTPPPWCCDLRAYHQIGHSCLALMFGLIGAILGFAISNRRVTESS